jgi:predicted transglutaminase-like cysteine proteinase
MKTATTAAILSGILMTLQNAAPGATFQQTAQLWAERGRTRQLSDESGRLVVRQPTAGWFAHNEPSRPTRTTSAQDVDTAVEAASTPKEFCRILADNVKYQADTLPNHEWKLPDVTWADGWGDCEDFALCVKRFCDRKGIVADVRVYRDTTTGKAHAVAVGEWGGGKWMSSNGSYVEVTSDPDVRDAMARFFGCGKEQIVKQDGAAANVAGGARW